MSKKDKGYHSMCTSNSKDERKYIEICRYCFKDIHTHEDFIHYLSKASLLCGDCRKQMIPLFQTFEIKGMKVFGFYRYNRFLEGMIFQYKEGRDTALKDVFFDEIKQYIEKHYRKHTLVLMPSSQAKNKERGFYALEEMVSQIKLKKITPFIKIHNMKQSKRSYEDREKVQHDIVLDYNMNTIKGPLLLIDDVMTSGSTMYTAYQLLKDYPDSIHICVLAIHDLLLDYRCRNLRWNLLAKKS